MNLAQSDINEMVRVLRHRLRNHVSGIKTAIDLLEQELADSAGGIKEYFPLLRRECMFVDTLACRFGFALEDRADGSAGDAGEIYRRACGKLAAAFPGASIESDVSGWGEAWVSSAESVERCFYELLANALEACRSGTVRVKGDLDGGFIRLRIRDSGERIPDEVFKKMKKPFFTTRSKHAGMGLSIVQNVLAHTGGGMKISRMKPSGLEVLITIPRYAEGA